MKKVFNIILLVGLTCSCKKQNPIVDSGKLVSDDYLVKVSRFLKDSLNEEDYGRLDFRHGLLSKQKQCWYLRLAWLHKKPERDFILLQTDSLGNCKKGHIILLDRPSHYDPAQFYGQIDVLSLQRKLELHSIISNGFAESLHPRLFSNTRTNDLTDIPLLLPAPTQMGPVYEELPEVMVVGYISPNGGSGISYQELLSFESLINLGYGSPSPGSGTGSATAAGSGGSAGSAVYSPLSGGSGSGIEPSQDLIINYESSAGLPGINLQSYMQCFANIPDDAAQCSLSLLADLPVNDNPYIIFNWNSGAVGHCFLRLTKSGNGESVSQTIGFAPTKAFQALVSSVPVAGKMVDNGNHKYNASLTMPVTPLQLNTAIQAIEKNSSALYDLVNFNCVNFSVQVINSIRPDNPLSVPLLQIPGNAASLSSTPEGLYILLNRMKAAGGPEASNIITDDILFAAPSHGPCN
jgi:hypothetical protein